MTQIVQLPDGSEAEFPDEMNRDKIISIIKSHLNKYSDQMEMKPVQSVSQNAPSVSQNAPYGSSFLGQSLSGLSDVARGAANSALVNPINFLAGRELLHPYQMELKGSHGANVAENFGNLIGILGGPGKFTNLIEKAPKIVKTILNIGGNSALGAAESPDNHEMGAIVGGIGGGLGEILQPISRSIASYIGGKTREPLMQKIESEIQNSYKTQNYKEALKVAKNQANKFGDLVPLAKIADKQGTLNTNLYQKELSNQIDKFIKKQDNPAYNKVFDAFERLKNKIPNSFEDALNLHEELNDLPKYWAPKETQANDTANRVLKGISGSLKDALKNSIQSTAQSNPAAQNFRNELINKLKDYSRYKFLSQSTQEGEFNPVKALKNYMNLGNSQKNIFNTEEKKLFEAASKAQTIKDKQKWLNKLDATFSKFPHWAGTTGKIALGGILGEMVGHPLLGASIPAGVGLSTYLISKVLANPKGVEMLKNLSQKGYQNKAARIISQTLAYPFYSEEGSQ